MDKLRLDVIQAAVADLRAHPEKKEDGVGWEVKNYPAKCYRVDGDTVIIEEDANVVSSLYIGDHGREGGSRFGTVVVHRKTGTGTRIPCSSELPEEMEINQIIWSGYVTIGGKEYFTRSFDLNKNGTIDNGDMIECFDVALGASYTYLVADDNSLKFGRRKDSWAVLPYYDIDLNGWNPDAGPVSSSFFRECIYRPESDAVPTDLKGKFVIVKDEKCTDEIIAAHNFPEEVYLPSKDAAPSEILRVVSEAYTRALIEYGLIGDAPVRPTPVTGPEPASTTKPAPRTEEKVPAAEDGGRDLW